MPEATCDSAVVYTIAIEDDQGKSQTAATITSDGSDVIMEIKLAMMNYLEFFCVMQKAAEVAASIKEHCEIFESIDLSEEEPKS